MHILVNTERGCCYRVADAHCWMAEAGFRSVVELEQTAVIQGIKP